MGVTDPCDFLTRDASLHVESPFISVCSKFTVQIQSSSRVVPCVIPVFDPSHLSVMLFSSVLTPQMFSDDLNSVLVLLVSHIGPLSNVLQSLHLTLEPVQTNTKNLELEHLDWY